MGSGIVSVYRNFPLRQRKFENLQQQIHLRRRFQQRDQVRQRIVVARELEHGRLDAGALALVFQPGRRVLDLDEADGRLDAEDLKNIEDDLKSVLAAFAQTFA